MDSAYFALAFLFAAFAGDYFNAMAMINNAMQNPTSVAAWLPILLPTVAIGLLAHHQRQSAPLPRE